MTAEDLCYTPATEQARLIREKALSPVELTRAVLERIEALNPTLNAYCVVRGEEALDEARAAEAAVMRGDALGPLHGVPVSIKDQVLTKGIRTMLGSRIFEHQVPEVDAPVVIRLREAGAILVGKTTVPEFSWKGCSDSPVTGVTHNPWKHGHNAGGSSAGAAVSAAAGLCALNQGSDGAGSVRMPAAFCGVFGLKPSYGRIPNYPTSNNDCMSHIGPLTRTVADGALMLSVMNGRDDRDSTSVEAGPADYLGDLGRGVRGLRVAWSPDLGYLPVDDEVAGPVRAAVGAFEEQGCTVEEVRLDWRDSMELIHFLWAAHEAGNLAHHLPEWEDRMDPGLVACIRDGLAYSAVDYIRARGRKLAFWDRVRPLFEDYDLLLTPSLSVAAFPTGRLIPEHWEQHPWDWIRWAGFSFPFNLTRQPAATVPCGFTADGRPVGLQIVGRRFADATVLQAAAAFEQARPWADKRPAL